MTESLWDEYQKETNRIASRLGKVSRKREIFLITNGDEDPVFDETLKNEIREVFEELIEIQNKFMIPINKDPLQMLMLLKSLVGK